MFQPCAQEKSQRISPSVGTTVRIGALSISLNVPENEVELIEDISSLYQGYPQTDPDELADFDVSLVYPSLWNRYVSRKLQVSIDGVRSYEPLSPYFGVPLLESTLNWCIGSRITRYLLTHAGVVARQGVAMIFPGASGSGKSTLSAVLASRGWRLLSDEIAMIRPRDLVVVPHPRPMTLKNASIEIVADRIPSSQFCRTYEGTIKGTVAFVRPPKGSIERAMEPAKPAIIVFPRFNPEEETTIEPVEKAQAFRALIDNTPNYMMLLDRGFETLAGLVEACAHYTMHYRDVDEAVTVLESLDLGAEGTGN